MRETGMEPEKSRVYIITPSVSLRGLFTVALVTLIWLMLFRSPIYEVSAKLLVKIGNEQASPPIVVGKQLGAISYRTHDINSEVEILSSPFALGEVVDHFGMGEEEKPLYPRRCCHGCGA